MIVSWAENGAEKLKIRCSSEQAWKKKNDGVIFYFLFVLQQLLPSRKLQQFHLHHLPCLFLVPEILLLAANGTRNRYQKLPPVFWYQFPVPVSGKYIMGIRPINALQLCHWQLSHETLEQTSSSEVWFYTENSHFGPRTMIILGSLESA